MRRNNVWFSGLFVVALLLVTCGVAVAAYFLFFAKSRASKTTVVPGEKYPGIERPPESPVPPPMVNPPGGGIPREEVPPGSDAARKGVRDHLTKGRRTLDAIPEANLEKPAPHEPRKYDTEVYLELICNYEVRRKLEAQQKSTREVDARIAELEKEIAPKGDGSLEEILLRVGKDKENGHPYLEAYSQWYALLLYGLRGRPAAWGKELTGSKGGTGGGAEGPAVRLLNDLKTRTGSWAYEKHGVEHIDGSVVTTACYVLLLLYMHTDWCNAGVGARLGTPHDTIPRDNPLAAKDRPFVVMLQNCCTWIEYCYPDGKVPTTTGLRYGRGQPERRSLVGGKVLYFAARMALAYETGKLDEYDAQAKNLYAVLDAIEDQLDKQSRGELKPVDTAVRDSYTYAYVMRALAIVMRLAARDGKEAATGRLVKFADKMLAPRGLSNEYKLSQEYSLDYLLLAILQYTNEHDAALALAGGKP